MNMLTLILLLNFGFTTEQETDLLIVNNDTIHLKSFPLEQLNLKFRPFGNTRRSAPSTSCWRGYRAIWVIIDNKMYLKKIQRCNGDSGINNSEDINELCKSNNLSFCKNEDLLFAGWLSGEFVEYGVDLINNKKLWYLADKDARTEEQLKLKINNGHVVENNHSK